MLDVMSLASFLQMAGELMTVVETGDLNQAGKLAHLCLCLVMGAEALAQRLRQLEGVAAEGNLAAARSLTTGMDALLEANLRDMRAALPRGDL